MLRKLSWSGIPEDCRATVWQLLMVTLVARQSGFSCSTSTSPTCRVVWSVKRQQSHGNDKSTLIWSDPALNQVKGKRRHRRWIPPSTIRFTLMYLEPTRRLPCTNSPSFNAHWNGFCIAGQFDILPRGTSRALTTSSRPFSRSFCPTSLVRHRVPLSLLPERPIEKGQM